MTPPPSAPAARLSRRAALRLSGLAPMAIALTACSTSGVRDRLDAAGDRLEAPRSTPPAPANPDQPRVDTVAAAIGGLRSALVPLAAQRADVAGLVALHTAHLKRLGRSGVRAPAVALDRSTLTASLRVHETALATTLGDQAASARDGELALLLASMSAAVAQRVALLSAESGS